MKFGTRRFLRSLILIVKLDMQKYRKILIWSYVYDNFTSFFLTKLNVKLQSYKFISNLSYKSVKFVNLDAKITLAFFRIKQIF